MGWIVTTGIGDRRKKDTDGYTRFPPFKRSPAETVLEKFARESIHRIDTTAKDPRDWPTAEPAEPKCKRRKRRLTSGY